VDANQADCGGGDCGVYTFVWRDWGYHGEKPPTYSEEMALAMHSNYAWAAFCRSIMGSANDSDEAGDDCAINAFTGNQAYPNFSFLNVAKEIAGFGAGLICTVGTGGACVIAVGVGTSLEIAKGAADGEPASEIAKQAFLTGVVTVFGRVIDTAYGLAMEGSAVRGVEKYGHPVFSKVEELGLSTAGRVAVKATLVFPENMYAGAEIYKVFDEDGTADPGVTTVCYSSGPAC
jgi:hypothetical protein